MGVRALGVWPLRAGNGEAGAGQAPTRYEAVGNVASNSDNFLRVLACQGMGIARLAAFHIGQDLREGRLCTVLSDCLPEQAEQAEHWTQNPQKPADAAVSSPQP
jgi:DNA-binding transcriptional LysR family regulator